MGCIVCSVVVFVRGHTIVGLFVISSYNYKLSLKLGKVMSKVIFRQKLITL